MNPPPDRRVIRAVVTKALCEYTDKITGWDGDLRPIFVERLAALCAISPSDTGAAQSWRFLTPRESDALILDCQVFTPAQLEQLTGRAQPAGSRDRRLTDAEIGDLLHWSESTIERIKGCAYRKVAAMLPTEMMNEFDALALDAGL